MEQGWLGVAYLLLHPSVGVQHIFISPRGKLHTKPPDKRIKRALSTVHTIVCPSSVTGPECLFLRGLVASDCVPGSGFLDQTEAIPTPTFCWVSLLYPLKCVLIVDTIVLIIYVFFIMTVLLRIKNNTKLWNLEQKSQMSRFRNSLKGSCLFGDKESSSPQTLWRHILHNIFDCG